LGDDRLYDFFVTIWPTNTDDAFYSTLFYPEVVWQQRQTTQIGSHSSSNIFDFSVDHRVFIGLLSFDVEAKMTLSLDELQ